MAIVGTLLTQAVIEADDGFVSASVSAAANAVIELDVWILASPSTSNVTGLGLTWERLDDPTSNPSEPMQRWAARTVGAVSGAVTFTHDGSPDQLAYQIKQWLGVGGTTATDGYRELSTGFYARKGPTQFGVPGDVPALSDPENRASVANAGSQSGVYPQGNLVGTTLLSRLQDDPNIWIELVSGVGLPGESAYGVTWTNGPFTARSVYSELLAEAPPPAEPPPPREGFPVDVAQIHSGHSLTDAGFHPWPGPYVYLLTEHLGVDFENVAKDTIPGGTMAVRWPDTANDPSARYDIANWELLVITEGVPLPSAPESAEYLGLYAVNAWQNGNGGAGAPTMLFATWTNIDGSDGPFRATLDEYEPLWENMAWAGTLELQEADENAPPIYIIPGNRLMMRLYDDIENDLAPTGVTEIGDYFRDTIHLNDLGSYAWAMLHFACVTGLSPVGLPADLWGPNLGWGDATVPDVPEPPNIPTPEQALYLQTVVWEVVTGYEWTGIVEVTEHELGATSLIGAAPVLGAPALGQTHELVATGLMGAAPVLGSPAIDEIEFEAPNYTRLVKARESVTRHTLKDPNSLLDYGIDWSSWLGAEERIVSSEWIFDSDALESGTGQYAESYNGTVTKVWLSGGADGARHRVTNRIVTDSLPPRECDFSFFLFIREG